jgi:Fe-S cluster biosynthesis and repair protein YggX
MTDYDYKSYEKCLEKILESTQKDYWTQYIDINRHQVIVGRAYLWVAAALIGAYTAGYKQFGQVFSNPIIFTLFLLAFLLSVVAFGICLYAMPARKGYQSVHEEGWGQFSHKAYNLLNEKKDNLYVEFLTYFISKFDNAHKYGFETNQKRAKLLRLTSWLLIISFVLAIMGLLTIGSIPAS